MGNSFADMALFEEHMWMVPRRYPNHAYRTLLWRLARRWEREGDSIWTRIPNGWIWGEFDHSHCEAGEVYRAEQCALMHGPALGGAVGAAVAAKTLPFSVRVAAMARAEDLRHASGHGGEHGGGRVGGDHGGGSDGGRVGERLGESGGGGKGGTGGMGATVVELLPTVEMEKATGGKGANHGAHGADGGTKRTKSVDPRRNKASRAFLSLLRSVGRSEPTATAAAAALISLGETAVVKTEVKTEMKTDAAMPAAVVEAAVMRVAVRQGTAGQGTAEAAKKKAREAAKQMDEWNNRGGGGVHPSLPPSALLPTAVPSDVRPLSPSGSSVDASKTTCACGSELTCLVSCPRA
jgi:hypothetical protein